MNIAKRVNTYICARCLSKQSHLFARYRQNVIFKRGIAQSTVLPQETSKDEGDPRPASETSGEGQAEGRMSERLAQMTDEMIEHNDRSAKKAIEEAGFSEELKKKLEARLQESSFRSENAAAFAQASLPVGPDCLLK